MSGSITHPMPSALPGPPTGGADALRRAATGRYSLLTRRDKVTLAPDGRDPDLPVPLLHLAADARLGRPVVHELARHQRRSTANNFVGLKNYETLFTPVPARSGRPSGTTSSGCCVLVFIATPIGIFLAVLLDREMRGTRIYQSAFFIPVVLSLAIVGFIWQLDVHVAGVHQQHPRAHRLRTPPSTGWATRRSTSGRSSSRPAGATSAT